MGAFSAGIKLLVVASILINTIHGESPQIRVRREIGGSQSLLTVEWEGIQTGDHPDDSVGGFAVEYRAEKDTQWHVHDGIIPYKGPNLQYRVQIPRLPTGIAYFVRIKVLGKNGKILVETPEIRARNEMVSIKCESDELTAPRNLEVTQTGQYSIAIAWEPPECGSVGEYHIELSGLDQKFDVHRQTVTHPSVSVTNLLPGTEYQVRVRAADRARTLGPWNEHFLVAKTEGEPPEMTDDIEIDYRTDSDIRISWHPFEEERLQHYEVLAAEVDSEGRAVERARVSPLVTSYIFVGLQSNTEYDMGVVAFVDHEPKLIYKISARTAPAAAIDWDDKPTIAVENAQQFSVHWKKPDLIDKKLAKFLVEYRLPNETEWRKYEEIIVEDDSDAYNILFDDIYDGTFYSFRILAVDSDMKLVAKTAEITIGNAATESCAGEAGVPNNVRASFVSDSTIQFAWEKPQCDETYGPVDGYEYTFWNTETSTQPEIASYVGRNAVALNDLDSDTRYAFRVRSRAGHGHSTWSNIVHATTEAHSAPYDGYNIYQLRIILAPPRSYLAWTPLPEHRKDVTHFKLSYKKSAGDEWTRVIEPPSYFKCPEGVADPEDFCYDLSQLSSGVQYTADLVYELKNNEWTSHGSPLFFIMVEAVGAPKSVLGIEKPRIEQRGTHILLYWTVGGDTSNLHAYQIDLRSDSDRDWHQFDSFTPHSPPEINYKQELKNLETNKRYYVRVSAIDRLRKTVATSEATSFTVQCQAPNAAPEDVRLENVATGVRVLWSWNGEVNTQCDPYFLISGYQNGAPFVERVQGSENEYTFQNAIGGEWQIEVRAGNQAGMGPTSGLTNLQSGPKFRKRVRVRLQRSICDPRTDFWCHLNGEKDQFVVSNPSYGALISEPRVSTRGSDLHVEWNSEGTGRNVYGYRVQYRTNNTGWTPYGQIVPYVGDNKRYSQLLTGLQQGRDYHIHIQVLDRNSYLLHTSPDASGRTICEAPTHPPSHLQIEAPDSRHIRVSWAQPPQSTWQCNDIQVELQITEPPGVSSVILDGHQTTHVFDTEANQQWNIRIRSKNSAGVSSWSQFVSVRSPSVGELIVGPTITYRHGIPIITWSSKERVEDLIRAYYIEYRTFSDPDWKRHRIQIPYIGWQRPYSLELRDLPSGHNYQVRILAMDANNGIAHTSSAINVQTKAKCDAPSRTPSGVKATSLGPMQIRVSWRPLHESEWNCDRIWYIVKYSTPQNSGFRNLTHGEDSVIFESQPFTKWSFEVQAANPSGETHWSHPISVQTEGTAPEPVSDFNIYAHSSDSLQLSWRQPQYPHGQITGYEITYQLLSKGMCDQIAERPITVLSDRTSYVLKGLSPHSKYRVSVAAKTSLPGERVTKEILTEEAPPSAAPMYIRAISIRPEEVDLVWQAPACLQTNGEITEYEYEARVVDGYADRGASIRSTIRGGTRAKITGLLPYIKYLVQIRAFTRKGPGPWSEPVQFQTAAAPEIPPPPMVRVFSTGSNNAHLVWQEPYPARNYIDKYKCQYAIAGTKQYQEQQFPAHNPCGQEIIRMQRLPPPPSGTRFHCGRIDGLQPEKEYTFRVSAGGPGGAWSPWSESQVGHISESPVQVISLVKISSTATSIVVGWNVRPADVVRVLGYRIHVSPMIQYGDRPQTFTVDRSTLQYQIDNLMPNTRYNITVDATTDGRYYHSGTSTEMKTESTPLKGLLTAPRVTDEQPTSVTLMWDVPPSEIVGFIIEYRLSDGVWKQFRQRVPAHSGKITYTQIIDQLPTNSVIDLRIRAITPQNEQSPPSPEVRARTRCSAPPAPPQAVRLDAPSTNEVRVSWARPAKDTWQCDQLSYEIAYRIAGQGERVVPIPGDQTEYTFPADANTRWAIKLRSTNQVGSSPWSNEQVITTRQGIPGPVRSLRLRARSPNEVHAQWSAPLVQRGTIVGYDISYRLKHRLACPEEEPRDVSRDFVTVYNHKDLEYTITGLLPFSLYEVRVRARTTELGPKETREIATEQQPPSAPPLNLQLTYALERSINFQWEAVECSQRHGHIVNYEYEIQGQDDWAKLERQIANTTDTRVTIEGLTPYTKYVMRVKAYNSIGGGPNTENLDAMTVKADAPLPPQDLVVAKESTDSFMVSWLPPYPPYGPHDKYKIRYQQLKETGLWKEEERRVEDRSLVCPAESPRFCFNVTGLESGRQFRVQVAAHILGGSYGPWSSVTIANTLQILPDAPRAIELIAKTDHSLHIKWIPPLDPLKQISQYKVGVVSLDVPNDQLKTYLVDHPTLQFLLENLQPETSYNISISAGTKRGFGPAAWTRYSTDPFKVPPVTTAPLVSSDGPEALDVHWNGVLDTKNRIHGYIIEFRSSDNPVFTEYDGVIEHESGKRTYQKKLTGLDPDTLYFVRIKVVDHKQRISSPSPEGSARTGCAPPLSPPSNVDAFAPSPYQVRVNWQPATQSSWQCSKIKYKLEYINGTSARQQTDVPSGETGWVFDASPNTIWKMRVRIENEAGASDWSKEVLITTAEGAPGVVDGLEATPEGPESASVTWNPPKEANGIITGYTLVYRLKSIGECGSRSAQPITKNTRDERILLDGLLPDSVYDVHVTAHTSQTGPQSNLITVKTQEAEPAGPPLHPRVSSVTQTRADFSYSEPECERRNGKITGYEYDRESLDEWDENTSGQSTTQRVSFDNLIPYTNYRVRVRAQNSVGEGPWTEWITFRTLPAAPPPPTDLLKEQSFPHAIEISFHPPHPQNGIINEYKVRYTPSQKLNYKEVRVHESRLHCSDSSKSDRLCYRVSDLEPDAEYEIQVAAHTENGAWGQWSESLSAKTHEQNIPVLERELEVIDTKPNSITLKWQGLDPEQAVHIVGYVLEYKTKEEDWQEYNGITKHRNRQNEYKVQVKNLEPATEYFFRLRVVGKGDKRGFSGPEVIAYTDCGKPEEAPSNLMLTADYENVKLKWTNPSSESWKCGEVEYAIDFANTTSRGVLTVSADSNELILPTVPGTKWDIRMRTQTIEEGHKPLYSPWSDRVSLITQSLPGELFLKVEPKTPRSVMVIWDLADQDQKWNYGVDVGYRLKQLGGCVESRSGDHDPVVNYNVQDKQVLLSDLKPGSEYELTVTPRRPPSLKPSVVIPKTVRRFRTKSDLPTGPPTKLKSDRRRDTEVSFKWEPPICEDQNGIITQYEYELTGVEEWNDERREGVTPRTNAAVDQLKPGSAYNVRVKAYTSEGPGPWSEPIQISTTGTELGAPRELSALLTEPRSIQLTWLPPYPERTPVVLYKLKYSPRTDDSNPVEMELSEEQLSCSGYKSPLITHDNFCTVVKSLHPDTTYRFAVQAQSPTGNWGEWSPSYFATTRSSDDGPIVGKLRLVSAGHDNLRVNWTVPPVIRGTIDQYLVNIMVASAYDGKAKQYKVPGDKHDFHFRDLEPVTHYNITVQGLSKGNRLWYITEVYSTTDFAAGLLNWLPAPTDLKLLEKSDTMLHVAWSPPEIFDPQYKDLITHYRVIISPFDKYTGTTGHPRTYTVPFPRTSIRFDGLAPDTIYNITVQAGTDSGYGQELWGVYSTLATGKAHILRLRHRTPTTLTVEWDPVCPGSGDNILSWRSLYSVYPYVRLQALETVSIDSSTTEYTIKNLIPATMYNVTLHPRCGAGDATGAYATSPPGWFVVRNLIWCDRSDYAVSVSWEPVRDNKATHYQVRYTRLREHDAIWNEEKEMSAAELLCPADHCGRHCYLLYNIENPSDYVFQVRAKVNDQWNHWKTVGKPSTIERPDSLVSCCIVPPPYFVHNIGAAGHVYDVQIKSVESRPQNVSRYYVITDKRDPPGNTNFTMLTDKVTAEKQNIPYYVTASFTPDTLKGERTVKVGDGSVLGGFLNYPLEKGKKYNFEIYSIWELEGKPAVVARQRASPYAVSGWPWWWLLLLLLLLLLLILLTCCLLWCLQGRYRTRKAQGRVTASNGQTVPLLNTDAEKHEMEENMQALSSRVGEIRSSLEQKATARGDFEDGYVRGFRDANKLGSASAARRRMDDDYGSRDDRFHEGYVKGLRDAGMTGMSTSMHNLAQRGQGAGYSSGYMQGFRDGNSGIFGDRITTNLLRRLEEQYRNQDEFRTGYIDGFKEGAGSRTSEQRSFEETRRLQESLTKLTEILQDKSKGGGEEIHTTKIFHVYNQQPEVSSAVAYSTVGRQLEQELEELASSSRRSTLRRHYTPGDYLKYSSDTEGYGSFAGNRRSLSASALARDVARETSERHRLYSGTGTSYISRAAADRPLTDTYSRRYTYRSRSDMGSPRRYASQTLLDGARPGPSTPHTRRDALHTLQRELDTLSRSPDRSTPRGYSSDTGYINDTLRSRTRAYSNYDYDTYQASKSEMKRAVTESGAGVASGAGNASASATARSYQVSAPVRATTSNSYSTSRRESDTVTMGGEGGEGVVSGVTTSLSKHNWPDDLIDIVNEPMGQTLDRMKKYSTSLSQVDREDGTVEESRPVRETVEERYQRSYKEEYTTGRR